jgi:ParB-like chromosome segregation protein Spo0J
VNATANTYAIHPLAHLLPEMREAEYAELREDIAANGLHEAITLYQEQILDGRHRYRACMETGTGPHYVIYDGDQPAAYVLSLNVKRRQLTQSQKAMLATDFLPHLREEAKHRQGSHLRTAGRDDLGRALPKSESSDADLGPNPGRSAQHAAEQVGVGHAQVVRANTVKRESPELAEQVRSGEITVTAAYEQVRKPAGERTSSPRRKPAELVENVVGMVGALPSAIDSIDVQTAVASADAPLADWDRKLTGAIVALTQLRKQIRGANA